LLRETFRLWRHRFDEPLAVVLVARASIARKKLAGVEKDFLAVLRQEHLLRKGE
jgi:RNase P protein component